MIVRISANRVHLALHVLGRGWESTITPKFLTNGEGVIGSSQMSRGDGTGLNFLERAEEATSTSVLPAFSWSWFLIIHEFVDLTQSDRQEKSGMLIRTISQDFEYFVKLGQHLEHGDNVIKWGKIHSE